jgi:hypothetical protein
MVFSSWHHGQHRPVSTSELKLRQFVSDTSLSLRALWSRLTIFSSAPDALNHEPQTQAQQSNLVDYLKDNNDIMQRLLGCGDAKTPSAQERLSKMSMLFAAIDHTLASPTATTA